MVVARTDAVEEPEILRRAQAMAQTDADVILVDGVRDAGWIRKVRDVIGGKPLLFNQIAGSRSPRFSLPELHDMGVAAAIYSTPCLFAAQGAIDRALTRLRHEDGVLPEATGNEVGVAATLALLERNLQGRPKASPARYATVPGRSPRRRGGIVVARQEQGEGGGLSGSAAAGRLRPRPGCAPVPDRCRDPERPVRVGRTARRPRCSAVPLVTDVDRDGLPRVADVDSDHAHPVVQGVVHQHGQDLPNSGR